MKGSSRGLEGRVNYEATDGGKIFTLPKLLEVYYILVLNLFGSLIPLQTFIDVDTCQERQGYHWCRVLIMMVLLLRIYEIYLKFMWIPYSNFDGKVYALAKICMNS